MTAELLAVIATCASAGGLLPTLVTVLGNRRKKVQLDGIEHELVPNSGKSLRDAVDRIEKSTVDLTDTVNANTTRIAALESRRRWRL